MQWAPIAFTTLGQGTGKSLTVINPSKLQAHEILSFVKTILEVSGFHLRGISITHSEP